LFGPVLGAAAYLLLEGVLSRWTEHWQAVLGPVLILVVLFSKSGLVGLVASIFPSSPGSTQGALEVAADGRVKLGRDETDVGPSTRDG